MPPADLSAWERVGPLLAARRAKISPRYANRRAFAADTGMNWRTLHDAEHAKRANFKAETLSAFESAYQLVPGSLERTLAGGDLEPAAPAPERPRLAEVPHAGMEPELVVRLTGALVRVAARGEVAKAKQEILALILESNRTDAEKAEMILDLLADVPSRPINWDQPRDGGQARHA